MIFGPALGDSMCGWARMLAALLPCKPQALKGDLFWLRKPGGSGLVRPGVWLLGSPVLPA